jgi:hypothetical protein
LTVFKQHILPVKSRPRSIRVVKPSI